MSPEKKITVITPTGDRPLPFMLCQRWMKQQTRKPDQWIVVDDGKVPLEPAGGMEYHRREPTPGDPKHTLVLNLQEALRHVKGDYVIVVEDDEYYAPRYIETMAEKLAEYALLVGIMRTRYYHLPTGGYMRNENDEHASLAETGFRRSLIPAMTTIFRENLNPFVDIRIWKQFMDVGYLFDDVGDPLYLGIKGLPGRAGIGGGHKAGMYQQRDNNDRAILKKWVPHDYGIYLDIVTSMLAGGDESVRARRVLCDIIIPTYQNEDFTINCVESIRRCTEAGMYRVIWVDNGSASAARVERALDGVNYIAVKFPANRGFVLAVNKGLSISNSDFVCILNNDTIVSPGWLQKIVDVMVRDPGLGIVGPLTAPSNIPGNYDSHHNIRHIEDNAHHRIFPEFINLEDFNKRIEAVFSGRLEDISFVAFLCAVIRREILDKVGLLDTNYAMGMYDDNDYNLAIRKAGYKVKLLWSTCIKHYGRSTFKILQATQRFDVNTLLQKNRSYLMKKWGLKKA